ncbi:EamA-like transporter family protein [Pseudomonas duriflava]|uniref:EamA-like transporter family protein n=1 Tax=Pseudomonas duriflava TaxID=459528 RepID=A0A562QFL3_9PSED|nr:DMT family transporter [Pseudomonas duriflava]TWI55534.1 EamA-like transporter family protein [Pseudomonas duriflava]
MRTQALRADILMLLTAIIWGSAFIAQRAGMDFIGPFLFSGLRFLLGALTLIPVLLLLHRFSQASIQINRQVLLGGGLMGLLLSIGINLQQVGLLFTSVTNSGFITGLYVIIVPILGLLFGERTHIGTWMGALLAVAGMALLSIGDNFHIASGDWLQLAGAFAWGAHVLVVGHYANRHDATLLSIIQFLVCAVISLTLAVLFEPIKADSIVSAMPTLLYGGIIAAGIGYTLQVVAQRGAIASHAAVLFSLEAVFAALFGAWLLDEALAPRGYVGCALMFAGMLLAQLWPKKTVIEPKLTN